MDQKLIDRSLEVLTAVCIGTAVVTLLMAGKILPAQETLAGLVTQDISAGEMERFRSRLDEVRGIVDSNGDPGLLLAGLQEDFPGRHEVWALTARYMESVEMESGALLAYAKAVRLEPDYLDERSPLYLGKRIQALTESVMDSLFITQEKDGGLDSEQGNLLKTGYFLKRRLAGGCE